MSEKFSTIFKCKPNLGIEESPVIIKAGALIINNENKKLLVQLKIQNISEKTVTLTKVKLTPLDSVQRELGEAIFFEYLDLNCNNAEDFGSKKPIPINYPSTRSFAVSITEVAFSDGTVWSCNDTAWDPLPDNSKTLVAFNTKVTHKKALELKSMGTESSLNEAIALFGSIAELENVGKLISECKDEISVLQEKKAKEESALLKKKKKSKKIALITAPIIIVIIILMILTSTVFTPALRYNKAMKLIEQGNDEEAYNILSVYNYKDSWSQAEAIQARAVDRAYEYYLKGDCEEAVRIVDAVYCYLDKADAFRCINEGDYETAIVEYGFTELVIPNGVTSITSFNGIGDTDVEKVVIPDTVTEIGQRAFDGCEKLTSINIPESVTKIGAYAFDSCYSLTSITIPNGVTEISDGAFYDCQGLTEINIPESVKEIKSHAFEKCSGLKNITIPKSISAISSNLFADCTSLSSITIPDSVNVIESFAFTGCSNLKSITVPSSVTEIERCAFEKCTSIESITLPSAETEISFFFLFNEKSKLPESLKSIVITGGTSVCEQAFKNFSSVVSITIPESVTEIGDYAFDGCSSLTVITLPKNIKEIKYGTFSHCKSLKSITIPDGVTNIASAAFYGCSSLESINIPNSVTEIGSEVFYDCTSLTKITLPDSITSLGSVTFKNSGLYNNEANWEDDVLYIGKYLIEASESVLGEYTVKEGTTIIASGAFSDCEILRHVIIPEGVTALGSSTFSGCKNLQSINIPSSVTSFDSGLFSFCTKIQKIEFNGTKAQWDAIEKYSKWDSDLSYYCMLYCKDMYGRLK